MIIYKVIFTGSLETRVIMNAEKIDSRNRLLHLIYEGKTAGILTDRSLRDSLNELMKYELITIYNNKLCLTDMGKIALQKGVNAAISKVRSKPRIPELTKQNPDQLNILMVTISLLLLVILLFMIL
jgi:hypothetical protein